MKGETMGRFAKVIESMCRGGNHETRDVARQATSDELHEIIASFVDDPEEINRYTATVADDVAASGNKASEAALLAVAIKDSGTALRSALALVRGGPWCISTVVAISSQLVALASLVKVATQLAKGR